MLLIEKIDLYKDGNERDLFIFEGPSYNPQDKPLIIFGFDAHNLFDAEHSSFNKSWEIPEAIESKGIMNYLIFGVRCAEGVERIAEYSPMDYWKDLDKWISIEVKPYGNKHIKSINELLIPYVENKFNFKLADNKSIMIGSSMGGLICTYYAAKFPHKFSSYLSMSPAYWANSPYIHEEVKNSNFDAKLYLDMGGNEVTGKSVGPKDYLDNYNSMVKILEGKNIKTGFFREDTHGEECWRKRFPDALDWLLG